MPTPSELKAEITTGPLADELAAAWANGDNQTVLDVLHRRDRAGYVPARWFRVALAKYPILDAVISWVMRTGQLPDGTSLGGARFGAYVLFRNLQLVEQSVNAGDLRADVGGVSTALAAAGDAGLVGDAGQPIPTAFGPYLLSGEVKINRVMELWGYDAGVTNEDIIAARRA